ncbi:hypothetical protein Ahy_A03g010334 [Arachis hypogaea]|uniref:Uncharacterized protein n=1 Tax=Arachis hypogaea TaxID=3818 RepID=A0A445DLY5_ARAHY|nr:hypothetical protein Ahy_A03g010334 [Arachis hypogaea]
MESPRKIIKSYNRVVSTAFDTVSNANNGENNTRVETDCGCASKKIAKNTEGNRSDKAWKHGISVDGDAKKIKYKYCDKVVTGGVYKLKHNLAGTKKDVELFMGVSNEVKKDMFDNVVGLQKNLVKKTRKFEENIQSKDEGVEEEGDALKPSRNTTGYSLEDLDSDEE